MDKNKFERYQRQMILKNFGEAAQEKLQQACVLVVGAGGLGCPVLQYLAAAGVGTIGIVDDDMVSFSNLQRQVLYSMDDLGTSKANRSAEILSRLNPEIKIIPYPERLTNKNALTLMKGYNIIIDGTDNFPARYMINDACVLLNKTLVYGAISQYEGQVAIFNYINDEVAVNYRDVFPDPPRDEILNCEQAGVLGVLPGIIGAMLANETIKLITGIGKPLINHLLTYNALNNQSYEIKLVARDTTRALIPAGKADFENMNYDVLCNVSNPGFEIDHSVFDDLLAKGNIDVIDVREPGEFPELTGFSFKQIPLPVLEQNVSLLRSGTVVTICHTGKRSLQAAQQLSKIFGTGKKIFSLRGGISHWKQKTEEQLI